MKEHQPTGGEDEPGILASSGESQGSEVKGLQQEQALSGGGIDKAGLQWPEQAKHGTLPNVAESRSEPLHSLVQEVTRGLDKLRSDQKLISKFRKAAEYVAAKDAKYLKQTEQ